MLVDDRALQKAFRRENKRKNRRKHKVDGMSVFTIEEQQRLRAEEIRRKRREKQLLLEEGLSNG